LKLGKQKYDEKEELRAMAQRNGARVVELEKENAQLKDILTSLVNQTIEFKGSVSDYLVSKALLTHEYTKLDDLLNIIRRKGEK
jgi:spore coat protein CotF